MSSCEEKTLILKSADNEEFVVKESVAVQCITIKNLVEDGCDLGAIPLLNIDSKNLVWIIEFMEKHADSTLTDSDKKDFETEFVKKPFYDLRGMTLAANYLNFPALMNILCDACANEIKLWSVEQVREKLNIQNDYTEEEEKAVREENSWAFE